MTAIEAMNCVTEHLTAGDYVGAQHIVMTIEKTQSILPSSTFERVLRVAVKADCLTNDYRAWCQAKYGNNVFLNMLASCSRAS